MEHRGTLGQRDYRKFLTAEGQLNVRYLPRQVYTAIVKEYRTRDTVIDEVFEQLYLAWDLEDQLQQQKERGAEPDRAAAAQAVLDSLEDTDWWRVNAAFEKALIRDFAAVAECWADLLDPVYDDQEARGWRDFSA